jgi:hypothetical protein
VDCIELILQLGSGHVYPPLSDCFQTFKHQHWMIITSSPQDMRKLNICSGSEWLVARSELNDDSMKHCEHNCVIYKHCELYDTRLWLMHVDHRCFCKNFDSKLGMGRLKGHDRVVFELHP